MRPRCAVRTTFKKRSVKFATFVAFPIELSCVFPTCSAECWFCIIQSLRLSRHHTRRTVKYKMAFYHKQTSAASRIVAIKYSEIFRLRRYALSAVSARRKQVEIPENNSTLDFVILALHFCILTNTHIHIRVCARTWKHTQSTDRSTEWPRQRAPART